MPTGKAININSRTKNFRPPLKKTKKIKKLPVLERVTTFGVTNKYAKLNLPSLTASGPSTTPLGEVKQFTLRSLKAAVSRLKAEKPTRLIKNLSQIPEGENIRNYKFISQTDRQRVQSIQMTQVPFKTIENDIIQKSRGRIVLNPGDLGFYGHNGTQWVPFKTPTFSLTTILKTGNNAGGQSLVNVGTINSNTASTGQMNVNHVQLGYWNPTFTLEFYGTGNVYNVNNIYTNTIDTNLYNGNYSSFERVSSTISGDVLYSLIDKGNLIDYEWNAHFNRITRAAMNQGSADVNTLGEIVIASTYATLDMLLYDISGSSTSLTFSDLGVTSGTPTDVFIVKYNADGTIAWKNRMIHTTEITARGISTNLSGNILLTGSVNTGSLQINDVTGITINVINTTNSGYITQYTSNGVYRWISQATSTFGSVIGYAVSVNNSNAIVATGSFIDNVTIYGAFGSIRTLTGAGPNCYLVKYSNSGVIQWATRFTANVAYNALDVDITNDGSIYVGGSNLNSFIYFYSVGNILSTIVIPNYGGGFVAKYNSNGIFQWASYILGGFSTSLRANINNELAVCGYFQNLLRVYSPFIVAPSTLYAASNSDAFLVKYSGNDGAVQWLTNITNSPISQSNLIKININDYNQVVISGNYSQNNIDIYSYASSTPVTLSGDANNTFIVNYNSNGVYNWATRLSSSNVIQNYSVNIQGSNEIFVTGSMNSTLSIYNTSGVTLLTQITNSLGNDVYLIKYTPTINSVILNPTIDGQTKVIASSSPKSYITSPAKINNQTGKIIVLSENQSVKLLWDSLSSNWIIQKNGGQLV